MSIGHQRSTLTDPSRAATALFQFLRGDIPTEIRSRSVDVDPVFPEARSHNGCAGASIIFLRCRQGDDATMIDYER